MFWPWTAAGTSASLCPTSLDMLWLVWAGRRKLFTLIIRNERWPMLTTHKNCRQKLITLIMSWILGRTQVQTVQVLFTIYIYMWRGIRGSTGPGKGKFRKSEGSLTLTLHLTILHSQSFMSQAAGRSQVQGKVSRTIIQWWEDLRPGLKWQTQQQRNGRQVREAHSELRPVRMTRKRESKTINTCGLVGPARQTQGPRQITLITLLCYR